MPLRFLLSTFFILLLSFSITFAKPKDIIYSKTFYFDTDSSILDKKEQKRLTQWMDSLNKLSKGKINENSAFIKKGIIKAYCDERKGGFYNKVLADKRAQKTKDFINELEYLPIFPIQTIPKGLISTLKGSGKDLEDVLRRNRKVEISVVLFTYETNNKQEKIDSQQSVKLSSTYNNNKALSISKIDFKELKVGDKIRLENILFPGGRHLILPQSIPSLRRLKEELFRYPKIHIIIYGHICCLPNNGLDGPDFDTGLDNLSLARAEVVYHYLIDNGISPKRLSYEGLKSAFPLGLGDAKDRRVEIQVSKIEE